jgi:sporulation protein YlmC with PRC-barrel domain
MRAAERRLELLIGQRVVDVNGALVGHLEEVVADYVDGEYEVREFHVGAYAMLERLGGGQLGRALLRLLGGDRVYRGYVVPWRVMDLEDPDHPRVTVEKRELRRLEESDRPRPSTRPRARVRRRQSA